jgi:hypothetical protein
MAGEKKMVSFSNRNPKFKYNPIQNPNPNKFEFDLDTLKTTKKS